MPKRRPSSKPPADDAAAERVAAEREEAHETIEVSDADLEALEAEGWEEVEEGDEGEGDEADGDVVVLQPPAPAGRGLAPEAAVVLCPDCGLDQVHDVLQAAGFGGDATVRCRECGRTHRTVLRRPTEVEVPVILSRQEHSERHVVSLPEDEVLRVEDELVAAEQQVQVRAIDRRDGKRVKSCKAKDIATLWVIHFEEIIVKIAVNMGKKTISKGVPVSPRDSFTVGDEFDLDRLRIYVHAIRTPTGTIHRGSAEAKDIRRIFARPVRLSWDERRARGSQLGTPPPKPRLRERRGPRPGAEQAAKGRRLERPPPRPGGARRGPPREGGRPPPREGRGPPRSGGRGPPRAGGPPGKRPGPRRPPRRGP